MTLEEAMAKGDFTGCSAQQLSEYLDKLCVSLGLNPLTRPFEFLKLNGKLIPYAKKDAADQLRASRGISVTISSRELHEAMGVYVVTAQAKTPEGRDDESIGAVNIKGLTGENLANAFMKAETKAKRRVTLSICGLGMSDETEIETIPGAQVVRVDVAPSAEPAHQPPAEGNGLISPKQLNFLAAKIREVGFGSDPDDRENGRRFVGWLAGREGLDDVKHLTRAEASHALDRLGGGNAEELVADWAMAEAEKQGVAKGF